MQARTRALAELIYNHKSSLVRASARSKQQKENANSTALAKTNEVFLRKFNLFEMNNSGLVRTSTRGKVNYEKRKYL